MIKMYQVDAFASQRFKGNPAAVCLLESWLPEKLMLEIAGENNLAETAFCIIKDDRCELRWFTPEVEIDLCGHATLATSHILFTEYNWNKEIVRFNSMSGELIVSKAAKGYTLNFPSRMPKPAELPTLIQRGIGPEPMESLKSRDYILVYASEKEVRDIVPDQKLLAQINDSFAGIIITAPGDHCDFVSRFFTPGASVFEDPVTGSAHCSLIPYWSEKLGKNLMDARQLSLRGGELECELLGDRVLISGSAVTFMKGEIFL